MNDIQKAKIINMRADGLGYMKIAKELEISENTVKSFCRRNNLTGDTEIKRVTIAAEDKPHTCEQCGKEIAQKSGRKTKRFCSDKCRMKWWNSHRDKVKHKKSTALECSHCHKTFLVYGGGSRKYCSHSCYIADRFGGEIDE